MSYEKEKEKGPKNYYKGWNDFRKKYIFRFILDGRFFKDLLGYISCLLEKAGSQ